MAGHQDKKTIKLNIVSVSLPKIILDVPASTTISQLKTKIHEICPSRPPISTQRLIHRGHVINQEALTLQSLFTQQIINSSDSLTLHLVTPSIPSNSTRAPQPHPATRAPLQATAAQMPQTPNPAPQLSNDQTPNPAPQLSNDQSTISPSPETYGRTPAHLEHTIAHLQNVQAQISAQLSSLQNHVIVNHQQHLPTNQFYQMSPTAQHSHDHQASTAQDAQKEPRTTGSPTSDATGTAQPSGAQVENATELYLLSSPGGPHALLVSPSGRFTAPLSISPHASHLPPATTRQSFRNQLDKPQTAAASPRRPHQGVRFPQPHMQLATRPPQPNAQHQQAQQARDLARILFPLAGHTWLAIRLIGFLWLFKGSSWSRTLLLWFIAVVVFIHQSNLLRPMIQRLFNPVRRHMNNLVPLGGQPNPDAGAVGQLVPQDTAQRLLDERQRRDGNVVRALLRRCERAVALFITSLAPGVAEAHIRAREAEAAIQREISEREEREREEQEEAQQQTDDAASNDEPNSNLHQDGQPPLIEV